MANKIVNQIKKLFSSQLAIPLVALIVLVIFNRISEIILFYKNRKETWISDKVENNQYNQGNKRYCKLR